MKTFWNACISLGSIDSLLYIYCSIFNMKRIVLSKWCFRQESDFSFLSLRVPDLTERKCFGKKEWSENTENSILFLKTVLYFKKKYFEAILFSINYRVIIHWKVSCIVICTEILTSCKSKINKNFKNECLINVWLCSKS